MRFQDKRVIVTGAASGIGRATALRFAEEGAHVVIADINEAGLAETAGLMTRAPTVVPYDAADWDSCRALVAAAVADGPLHVLANIAGMLAWGPTLEFDEARFEKIIAVNLTSVFAMSHGSGRIYDGIPRMCTTAVQSERKAIPSTTGARMRGQSDIRTPRTRRSWWATGISSSAKAMETTFATRPSVKSIMPPFGVPWLPRAPPIPARSATRR